MDYKDYKWKKLTTHSFGAFTSVLKTKNNDYFLLELNVYGDKVKLSGDIETLHKKIKEFKALIDDWELMLDIAKTQGDKNFFKGGVENELEDT